MQGMVPGFMKFVTRPLHGVVLRILAFCLIVVAIIAAILDAKWGGFTPVVWLLLAFVAIMGVICNELAQIIRRMDRSRRRTHHSSRPRTAVDEPPTRAATAESIGAPLTEAKAPVKTTAPVKVSEKSEALEPVAPDFSEVEIYCVKCREKRMIRDPETIELANGRPAYQGACPVCGTKVTRIRKTA